MVHIILIVYWLILLAATSLPSQSVPSLGLGDKLNHLGAYLVLNILLNLSFSIQQKSEYLKKNSLLISFIVCIVYGAVDELHQMLIPGRSCEFMDWIADSGGSLLGSLIMWFFNLKILKKQIETKNILFEE
jgi:VanZ family protein